MRVPGYLLLVFLPLLTSCASQIVVTEIGNKLEPGEPVNGFPFRIPKRFDAVIFEKSDQGYRELSAIPVTIADPDRLFALNFRSQLFSNGTMEVTVNPDNTIQQVTLTSKSTGGATLTALGTQINGLATAGRSGKSAESAAETAQASALLAADKARQGADLAILQYQTALANSGATPIDLLKASQAMRSAQLNANEKARLAGRPLYFPGVMP